MLLVKIVVAGWLANIPAGAFSLWMLWRRDESRWKPYELEGTILICMVPWLQFGFVVLLLSLAALARLGIDPLGVFDDESTPPRSRPCHEPS